MTQDPQKQDISRPVVVTLVDGQEVLLVQENLLEPGYIYVFPDPQRTQTSQSPCWSMTPAECCGGAWKPLGTCISNFVSRLLKKLRSLA